MNNAQQNIAALPYKCFGILPVDKSIIQILAGEMGYYPLNPALKADLTTKLYKAEIQDGWTNEQIVNELNTKEGITIQQRKAMEWGSMMGWGGRLATAEGYDETGRPISEKNTFMA